MATVAITGASGSLGRALCISLRDAGHDAITVGRRPVDGGQAHVPVDLLGSFGSDLLAKWAPSHLIHAAWVTAHPAYWSCPSNADWQKSSLRLAESFAMGGGRHMTFVTTCAEYDWRLAGPGGVVEGGYPATFYGASKRLVTEVLRRRAPQLGIGFAACRIFMPFSADEVEKRVTTLTVDRVLRGEPFHLRSADVERDIYSTASAGRAIAGVALSEAQGPFDISSGRATHLGRFLRERIASQLGAANLVTWDPYDPETADPETNPPILVGNAAPLAAITSLPEAEDSEIERLIAQRRDMLKR